MIISTARDTIPIIKNIHLLYHVMPGLVLAEDFRQRIKRTGIGIDETDYGPITAEKQEWLRKQGANFGNGDKSIYINRISPACLNCGKGEGAVTVDITHNCNRRCFHCFGDTGKIPEGQMYDYLGLVDDYGDLQEIRFMGLSGGEPLLYKSHALNCLGYVYERFPEAHKRLYTNGDFLDEEVLQELQEVRLDEIRFSIKHTDFGDWSDLKSKMELAMRYIPHVMVEMPVMPGTLSQMKEILLELDRIGIFGINLCEFCYCMHHAEEYNSRNYRAKFPPFKILYLSRRQYPGIPVAGSDLESYDLLAFALERNLRIGVHYCSVENRLTSPIYEMNHGQANSPLDYFSQKDFFIKSAIACGEEDILKVSQALEKNGVKAYRIMEGFAKYIEFNVAAIELLKDLDIEIGIVSSVIEADSSPDDRKLQGAPAPRKAKRVVKIDLTYPRIFDFKNDV